MVLKKCLFRTSKNKVTKQDYAFVILASIIAACGFALNSETVVIGSMLISPLLKPIINVAISILKGKKRVLVISLVHTIAMIFTSGLIGALIGWIFYTNFPYLRKNHIKVMSNEQDVHKVIESETIFGRVSHSLSWPPSRNVYFISLIAIAGGILLARTNCTDRSNITTAIIGTGIATSVLPPIIAGSMMLSVNHPHSWEKFGNGMLLSSINITLIFLSYMATLFLSW
jgi:uncharacterized membrane protein